MVGSAIQAPSDSRRAADRALAHWNSAWSEDGPPTLAGVMSANQEHQLDPHCFLLKEDADPDVSVFVHCGDGLSRHFASKVLRQTVAGLTNPEIRKIFSLGVAETVRDKAPVHHEGSFLREDNTEVRYRSVFMPVRADHESHLGYIFGTFRSKSYLPAH